MEHLSYKLALLLERLLQKFDHASNQSDWRVEKLCIYSIVQVTVEVTVRPADLFTLESKTGRTVKRYRKAEKH